EVSLDNTQGLGRGNIANDGLLTLKNVTGELRNSISGKGIVSAFSDARSGCGSHAEREYLST
ncbi:hypothetical protein E2K60_20935, partial [Escherichia coli]